MKKFYFYFPTLVTGLFVLFFSLFTKNVAAQATTSLPPAEAATGTWQTNRGCLRAQGTQYMKGNYVNTPVVKWRGTLTSNVNSGGCEGEPAIGDINGDGTNEVVEAVDNGDLMAFEGATGVLLWTKAAVALNTSPVIADADNDGKMDLAVANNAQLFLLDGATGNIKWTFTPAHTGNSSPSVADLEHNGDPAVIFISGSACYAVDGKTGTQRWVYDTGLPLTTFNGTGPAIGDLNNDGIDDVVASLQNKSGTTNGTVLVALDGKTGALLWSVTVNANNSLGVAPFPAIGDVDGDCNLDVVYCGVALKGINGTVIWGSPTAAGTKFNIVADLLDNCTIEVVNSCGVKNAATGTNIWSLSSCSQYGWFAPAPKVGEFDSNSPGKEIIVGAAYQIQGGNPVANPVPIKMYAGMTGTVLWTYDIATLLNHTMEGMSVGDIDNDGCVEIVIAPDCCNGENSLLALDDSGNTAQCGILASIGQVDFISDSVSCTCRSFSDFSSACANTWNWSFPGGTPSSSTAKDPGQVCYANSGTYTVTMTAKMNACANADTVVHTIVFGVCSLGPVASFTSSDTVFCNESGKCISFTDHSTGNPTSWQWIFTGASPDTSTQQNPTNICYYVPGTYPVTLIVSNSAGSDTLAVTPLIVMGNTPAPPTITASGDTLCSSPEAAYQWYFNGSPIAGAIGQCYTATQNGLYAVQGRDSIGCITLSNGQNVTITSVNELIGNSSVSIYPNPVSGEMIISFGSPLKQNTDMVITDVLGKELGRATIEKSKVSYSIRMDEYANGIYLLQLRTDNQMVNKKFVVVH